MSNAPGHGETLSDDAEELLGTTVDRYRVEGILGEGSFGAVALARHVVTGREVALKVLHARRSKDPSIVQRFIQEAQAATAIGHPNIIDVLDAGCTTDGRSFLVTERLVGASLREQLDRIGRLPLSTAVALMQQILDGLSAAHAKGIIHRDLKPENMFLATISGVETLKLLDFGISKIQRESSLESLTQTGTILGTPHYMAPEQFQGAKDLDGRADLYGASVVFYEMLSGRFPYEADGVHTLMMKMLTEPPTPIGDRIAGVPQAICDVMMRGLATDRDARFPDANTYGEALHQAVAGLPATAPVSTLQVLAKEEGIAPAVNPPVAFGAAAPPKETPVPYAGGVARPPHPGTPAGNPFASSGADRVSVPLPRTLALATGGTSPHSTPGGTHAGDAKAGKTWPWLFAALGFLGLLAMGGVGLGIWAVVQLDSEPAAPAAVVDPAQTASEDGTVYLGSKVVVTGGLEVRGDDSADNDVGSSEDRDEASEPVQEIQRPRAGERQDVAAQGAQASMTASPPPVKDPAPAAGGPADRLLSRFTMTSPMIDRADARRLFAPFVSRAARCAPTGTVNVTVAFLFSGGDSSLMSVGPHPPWNDDPVTRCMVNVFSGVDSLPGSSGIVHLRLYR